MGMFDDVDFEPPYHEKFHVQDEELFFQTKDLECDGSRYVIQGSQLLVAHQGRGAEVPRELKTFEPPVATKFEGEATIYAFRDHGKRIEYHCEFQEGSLVSLMRRTD